ncbi:MAG: presenilin family intramembrane aspartyl protease, partial [Candidatus Thermoplasmatota archaeon]|nr:presenilin family intramembrane aspartyl protease [Candidatus Thermoplasmatota archaeon]
MPEGSAPEGAPVEEGAVGPSAFGRAALPIAMTVGLIIVTISLALFIGPFYSALGMNAGMGEYAENPLYAFLFLGMVIVMAVVILLLRKFLKRRRLKLKYLLAFAVLLSTTTVFTPFIDIAANGVPEMWKEYHFEVKGANRALPLNPLDMDAGLLVLTESSFHALKRSKGEYTEVSSVKGLTMVDDPSFNAGVWTVLGVKDGKATVWSVTTAGDIVLEWEPTHGNGSYSLLGTSTASASGKPYIMAFWNGIAGAFDITFFGIGSDHPTLTGEHFDGTFDPAPGFSNGLNFIWNETRFYSIKAKELNDTIEIGWGGGIVGGLNLSWAKIERDIFIAWSDHYFIKTSEMPQSTQTLLLYYWRQGQIENSHSSDFIGIHDVPPVSPYLTSIACEVTTGNEFGRVQAIYVVGRTLYKRLWSNHGPFDSESYTLTETPIGLFAEDIDGRVIIVDEGTVSMGTLTSEERMQWWVQGSAFLLALGLVILIMKKPKWWLIDLAGILMGAGVVALMGISFPLLFTLLLLVLLAGYDAVAVYKTKHMIALADSVVEAKMPILLVFPMRLDYRYEDETNLMDPKRKRRSLFMGLGDVIIPGILIVSAYSFLPSYGGAWLLGFIPPNLGVAILTLAGMLMGYAVLIGFVLKGKA